MAKMNWARAVVRIAARSPQTCRPGRSTVNSRYSVLEDQRHDGHVGRQPFLAQADPQGDRVEAPTPIPLVAVAPGRVGVGLGLGDLVQRNLADGGHELQRAERGGEHARGRQRQLAAAEDRQIGVDGAGLHGFLHQGIELRGLQIRPARARARIRRESAIRHRGPHHRRMVVSLKNTRAVSSGSPSR